MVRHLGAALIGLGLFAAATPAFSIEDWLFGNRLNVPRDQWLSPSEVIEKLSAKGFRVVEIEADDGAYEVEMLDENGTRIETYVHPATAELLYGYDD